MQGQPFTPAVEIGRGRYSPNVLKAIDRALALEANERPQSVAEFRALIANGQLKQPQVDPNVTTVVQPGTVPGTPEKRSGTAPRLLLLGALVVAIGAAAWYVVVDPGTLPSPATSTESSTPPTNSDGADDVTEAPSTAVSSAQVVPKTDTQVATVEPPLPAETAPPPTLSPEDGIIAGFDMPPDILAKRQSHISGTLLAYVQTKLKFDDCQKTQPPCKDSASLLQATLANQEGAWKAPSGCEGDACAFTGIVKVTNPRRLDREDCPFLIDVTEVLRHAGAERKQMRTYCTADGFNRHIDSVGPVT
jgi:hypothetical protein